MLTDQLNRSFWLLGIDFRWFWNTGLAVGTYYLNLPVDFGCFWSTGLAVLRGNSPYMAACAFYPPLTSYLFAVLGLLPRSTALILWEMANVAMLVHICKGRRALAWVLFWPILFVFLSGNIDLLPIWASQYLGRKGWRSAVAVLIICLKPQMAWILLPFWIWKWAREDVPFLFRALSVTAAINLLPGAIRPTVFGEWIAALRSYGAAGNGGTQPGLWQYLAGYPSLLPAILAVSLIIVLLCVLIIRVEPAVRAAMLLAIPAGHGYDIAALVMQAPAWLLVPASWVGVYLVCTQHTGLGHMLMPVAVLAWVLFTRLRDKKRATSGSPARPIGECEGPQATRIGSGLASS